jgi:hypothetical protein
MTQLTKLPLKQLPKPKTPENRSSIFTEDTETSLKPSSLRAAMQIIKPFSRFALHIALL